MPLTHWYSPSVVLFWWSVYLPGSRPKCFPSCHSVFKVTLWTQCGLSGPFYREKHWGREVISYLPKFFPPVSSFGFVPGNKFAGKSIELPVGRPRKGQVFLKSFIWEVLFVCSSFFVTQNLGCTYDGDDSNHPRDLWQLYIWVRCRFSSVHINTFNSHSTLDRKYYDYAYFTDNETES